MSLQIGDTAPDFHAHTTEGRIRFHEWISDSWCVLFSHPKDFTPVCTTELGYMARIKPEFDKRDVKIIALSVDPVDSHSKWADDIKETQGSAPNYPIIGDTDLSIAKAWGMLPAAASGEASKRTAAENQTVRSVFAIGPDKKVKLILAYPSLERTGGGRFLCPLQQQGRELVGHVEHHVMPACELLLPPAALSCLGVKLAERTVKATRQNVSDFCDVVAGAGQ
jgi:alkyl hydroperoxide reductase subunit AhpC